MDLATADAIWRARRLEDFVATRPRGVDSETAFDLADGLDLKEGRQVALAYNPGLSVARLEAERAHAGAAYAGLWSDPTLGLDLRRVTSSVPDPWVLVTSLVTTLPISGVADARKRVADAGAAAASAELREAEWQLWRDVRVAWIAWTAATWRVEVTERHVERMEELEARTRLLADRGEMLGTQALLFGLERAQSANRLRILRGERGATEQELRSLLGLAPEAPAVFAPSLPGPLGDLGEAAQFDLDEGARAEHPTLARLRAAYRMSEEALRREVRRQWPGLSFGPQFETEEGQERVGLLLGLTLPLWNRNRRAIAEARASRELARAAFEAQAQLFAGRRAVTRERVDALRAQLTDLETGVAPLVDGLVDDALALLRLGEGSNQVLLESLVRALEVKLAWVDARADEERALAELEFLDGPLITERSTSEHGEEL